MDGVTVLAPGIGLARACRVMNVDRSAVYRVRAAARRLIAPLRAVITRCRPPLAFSDAERQRVLDTLNSERFAECSPRQTYASLLDEGVYLASVRTMYRLLAGCDLVRERRNQLTHPAYAKPELLATQANQVWSWDITKLRGPQKWTYFQLYVILDIFSRYVVGWMIAHRETAELAEQLIADTIAKQRITPGSLTLHADCGPACAPSRSPPCWSIWRSPRPTAVRMSPMTTRTPRRNSRPSNTVPTSRIASVRSRMRGLTAMPSLPGTTRCIGIRASA